MIAIIDILFIIDLLQLERQIIHLYIFDLEFLGEPLDLLLVLEGLVLDQDVFVGLDTQFRELHFDSVVFFLGKGGLE
jgi:hypothetical protein